MKIRRFVFNKGQRNAAFGQIFNEHFVKDTNVDEVFKLKREVKEMQEAVAIKKYEQKKYFRKRYENFRGLNKKYNVQYDLIQAALFGNNIVQ